MPSLQSAQTISDDQPTMRLRDRRSESGVLGDITNRKEKSHNDHVASKSRSKVRNSPSSICRFNLEFERGRHRSYVESS